MTSERKLELLKELTDFAQKGDFNVEEYTQLLFKHINEGFVTSHKFLIDFLVEMALTLKSYDLLLLAVNASEIIVQYKLSELSYDDYRTLSSLKIKALAYYTRYVDPSKRSEVEKLIYCYQDSFGDGEVYQYQAILDSALEGEEVNPFNQSMVESYLIKYYLYGNEASDDQLNQIGVNKGDTELSLEELFNLAKEKYRLSFVDSESSKLHLKLAYSLSLIILNKSFKKSASEVVEYEKLAVRILYEYNSMRKLSAEDYLDEKYKFEPNEKKQRIPSGSYFKPSDLKPVKKHVEKQDEYNKDITLTKDRAPNKENKSSPNFLQYVPIGLIGCSIISLIFAFIYAYIINLTPIIDSLFTAAAFLPFAYGSYVFLNSKKWYHLAISGAITFLIFIFSNIFKMILYPGGQWSNFFWFISLEKFIIPAVLAFLGGYLLPKLIKNKYLVLGVTVLVIFLIRYAMWGIHY